MAELATIARPYAEALFKASSADLDSAAVWIEELAAIGADPQLQQFARSPKASSQQVFDVIAGIGANALSADAKNFLHMVIENGRLSVLPEIAAQFRALKNARSGTLEAVIQSAFPIEGAMLDDVKAVLEKRFGHKLEVSVEIAPELIGGIRVVVGDEVLDTSVKARLEQMKVALTA